MNKLLSISLVFAMCLGATAATIESGGLVSAGDVGIGVTNVTFRLQVQKDLGFSSGENNLAVIRRDGNGGGFIVGYQADGSSINYGYMRGSGNYGTAIGVSGTNRSIFIQYPTGKVGIGTTNPATTLDVQGSGSFSDTMYANTVIYTNFCGFVTNFSAGDANSSLTNDTAEKTVLTWTIPAHSIGANGTLIITPWFTGYGNMTNIAVRYYMGGTQVGVNSYGGSAIAIYSTVRWIMNHGSESAQFGYGASSSVTLLSGSGLSPLATTVNTTTNLPFAVTIQNTGLAQTNQLYSLNIQLLPHQ